MRSTKSLSMLSHSLSVPRVQVDVRGHSGGEEEGAAAAHLEAVPANTEVGVSVGGQLEGRGEGTDDYLNKVYISLKPA